MEDIRLKVDISPELKDEFEIALSKAVEEFVRLFKLSLVKEIVSKSKFTEKDADELSNKVKESMHKRLKHEGLL